MASVRKKDDGMWLAQVRRKGVDGRPAINKSASFPRKVEAEMWANKIESEWRAMRVGIIPDIVFADLLKRYLNEKTPQKGGAKEEGYRINRILQTKLAKVHLAALSVSDLEAWYKQRLTEVKVNSANRERGTLSSILTQAVKWGYLPENMWKRIDRKKGDPARERRITQAEIDLIVENSGYVANAPLEKQMQRVGAAFLFALETAMRSGEICNMTWDDVEIEKRYVRIPHTKNGYPRTVPLSLKAIALLEQLKGTQLGKKVFKVSHSNRDALFRKITKRLMIEGLTFHDTRHEATFKLAQIYQVMDLAKITGHRDIRMLLNVYYNPTGQELAEKMQAINI